MTTQPFPERQGPDDQQQRRQENRGKGNTGPCPSRGRLSGDGTEIRRKGKQRTGNGLCHTITGKKGIVGNPTGRNHLGLKQWKHHMTAAEDERIGAVKTVLTADRNW